MTNGLGFGVSVPSGLLDGREWRDVTTAAGRPPRWSLFFVDFRPDVPLAHLRAAADHDALPILTWEPWHWAQQGTSGHVPVSLSAIAAGRHDGLLHRWADTLRSWGRPVHLRFAHEFNGRWYPWSAAGGTPAATYVDAWRHVHAVFTDRGADAVSWVWSPNAVLDDSSDLAPWYPGDEYVDVLGVDGYNWGTSRAWTTWTEPEGVFDATFAALRALAPAKPILVTEVGCAEAGGCKARWIESFVRYLQRQPDVEGFVWFEHDKETDWRIASSERSARALRDVWPSRETEGVRA